MNMLSDTSTCSADAIRDFTTHVVAMTASGNLVLRRVTWEPPASGIAYCVILPEDATHAQIDVYFSIEHSSNGFRYLKLHIVTKNGVRCTTVDTYEDHVLGHANVIMNKIQKDADTQSRLESWTYTWDVEPDYKQSEDKINTITPLWPMKPFTPSTIPGNPHLHIRRNDAPRVENGCLSRGVVYDDLVSQAGYVMYDGLGPQPGHAALSPNTAAFATLNGPEVPQTTRICEDGSKVAILQPKTLEEFENLPESAKAVLAESGVVFEVPVSQRENS